MRKDLTPLDEDPWTAKRGMHFDVDGNEITMREWVDIREEGLPLNLKTRVGPFEVSTVWLGLNHNYSPNGPPLIFETMVFEPAKGFSDLDCERYSTKEDAVAGHNRMVGEWILKNQTVDADVEEVQ